MGCGSSVERVRVAVDADEAWTPRRVNFDFGREAKKSLHSRFGPNRRRKRRVNFFGTGFLATFFANLGGKLASLRRLARLVMVALVLVLILRLLLVLVPINLWWCCSFW